MPYPEALVLLGVLLIATLCAHGLALWRPPQPPARFAAIDGLRGYLALMVYVHHGAVWWGYLHTGQWRQPPSRLMNNLGEGGVALFFMITALLFGHKLLQARGPSVDWLRMLVSRVLRLTPLYLVAMGCLFVLVAVASRGRLQSPMPQLLLDASRWLLFAISGTPDLNGVAGTLAMVAGVVWSLTYEWAFYAALPWLAMALNLRVGLCWAVASGLLLATIGWLAAWNHLLQLRYLVPFAAGLAACALVRRPQFVPLARSPAATLLLLALLAIGFLSRPWVYSPVPMLALAGAFLLLAAGNDLFGLLRTRAARTLGEMSYGLYLLHGLMLYTTLRVLAGHADSWPAQVFAWVQLALVPVLVGLCFAAHWLVERPAMRQVDRATQWLRTRRRQGASLSSPQPR